MAYFLLKILKLGIRKKYSEQFFGSLCVIKLNDIYMKKNEVFDSFSVIVRRQEWSWNCFTEHNILAFFIDYIAFSELIAWKIKNLNYPQLLF